jgi:hypothetical protein
MSLYICSVRKGLRKLLSCIRCIMRRRQQLCVPTRQVQ